MVKIAGKTASEARIAVQDHMKQFLDSLPGLSVNVLKDKSAYLVIKRFASHDGENAQYFHLTGNDTILEASQVNGLSQLSIKRAWIVRRGANGVSRQQTLPIDWDAISRGESTTSYQILPGDRLYVVAEEKPAAEETTIRGDWAGTERGHNYNLHRKGL